MDILVGLVVILGAVLFVLRWMPRTAHGLDFFASGFLPYRDSGAGWPHGVQEEDPRPWRWRQGSDSADDEAPQTGSGRVPELIEMDGDQAPPTTTVDRGPTVRGTSTRSS